MPEGYISPICQSLGKGLHRRALNAINRYDQLLVVWKYIPVPTTGRFPDSYINTHDRLPNSNESVTVLDMNHALLTYSDEIVQDFHLFPYYPLSDKDRQRHQLFLTRYALSYHLM